MKARPFFIIKLLLAAGALWYLCQKLSGDTAKLLSGNHCCAWLDRMDYLLLALAVALVAVNWGLESLKWHALVSKVEDTPVIRAVRAVLCGVCMNAVLPGRTGDIGGRIIWVSRTNRIAAAWGALVAGLCQLSVTGVAGIAGMLILLYGPLHISGTYNAFPVELRMTVLFLVACMLLWLVVLKNSVVANYAQRITNGIQRILLIYDRKDLAKVMGLSVVRYLIFSLQFYLLLNCFGVVLSFWEALPAIAATFFATTAIPLPVIADVSIRTPASVFFIGSLLTHLHGATASGTLLAIASASVLLWIINLAIPGMLGALWMCWPRGKSKD